MTAQSLHSPASLHFRCRGDATLGTQPALLSHLDTSQQRILAVACLSPTPAEPEMAPTPAHSTIRQTPSDTSVVTYRHLQSSLIGPQHPLRVIAHCDIDAAYAQFEQVRLGIDPSKPLAVQQWNGLIAINYPAREFGIGRHLAMDEAKKKCPDLICVHVATYAQGEGETEAKRHENPRPETHKVSLDPYRRESWKILAIFAQSCSVIEKASIDEAFLDFSQPVRALILEKFPHLASGPPEESPEGLDTPLPPPPAIDWNDLGCLVPNGEVDTTWSDVALAYGAEMMAACRSRVFKELQYTCSAGISNNKMLAKLCSAYRKPNEQTILRQSAILSFLRPMNFQKLRGLGGKLGLTLNNFLAQSCSDNTVGSDAKLGGDGSFSTIGDLWTVSLEDLQRHVGEETGMWIWEYIRGVDCSEVVSKVQTKSYLSSKNFRPHISRWDEGVHWLRILSTDLYSRLNEARTITPGIWPKVIALSRRNESYQTSGKQIAFPFTNNLTTDYILKYATKLLVEFVPGNKIGNSFGKVNNLGLAFQGIGTIEAGQKSIEGFFTCKRQSKLETSAKDVVCDSINEAQSIQCEDLLNQSGESVQDNISEVGGNNRQFTVMNEDETEQPKKKLRMTNDTNELLEEEASKNVDEKGKSKELTHKVGSEREDRVKVCNRCKTIVTAPDSVLAADVATVLEKLVGEHMDEHYARDLFEADHIAARPPPQRGNPNQKLITTNAIRGGKPSKGNPSKHGSDISNFFKKAK